MSRLIDADEALNLIDGETKVETNSNVKAFNDALEVAIQIIDTQKTVEAIPIEWIKDYILRTWLTDYDSPELKNIERMLNDWREEAENEN